MKFVNEGDRGITVGFDDHNANPAFSIANGDQSIKYISVASGGNVGIGTTSPGAKLDVAGTIDVSGTITAASDTTNPVLQINGGGPNFIRFASDAAGTVDADSIDLVYRTTPNTIAFERSSDATVLFSVDADDGNVGIGTSSPSAKLDVAGGNLVVQNSSGNAITLKTSVDNGNDSTFKLQKSRGGSGATTDVQNLDDIGTISWGGYYSGAFQENSTIRGEAIISGSYSDRLLYDSDEHLIRTNNTTRIAVTNAGDVGIGTSSPTEKLTVAGNIDFTSNTKAIKFVAGNSSTSSIECNSGSGPRASIDFLGVATSQSTDIVFKTSETSTTSAERMRIKTDSGNVGIGTSNPGRTLDVSGAGKVSGNFGANLLEWGYGIEGTTTSGTEFLNRAVDNDGGGNTQVRWGHEYDGAEVYTHNGGAMEITGNIDLTSGSTIMELAASNYGTTGSAVNWTARAELSSGYFRPDPDNSTSLGQSNYRWTEVFATNATINTSDSRLKTNVQTLSHGLEFINSLRPVSYKWIVGQNKVINAPGMNQDGETRDPAEVEPIPGTRQHFGLIAQEVKEVLDDKGVGDEFAGWTLSDKDDPESEQGLRYSEFIAPLIKAVQELSAQNEELRARVRSLEDGAT